MSTVEPLAAIETDLLQRTDLGCKSRFCEFRAGYAKFGADFTSTNYRCAQLIRSFQGVEHAHKSVADRVTIDLRR